MKIKEIELSIKNAFELFYYYNLNLKFIILKVIFYGRRQMYILLNKIMQMSKTNKKTQRKNWQNIKGNLEILKPIVKLMPKKH